MKVKELIEELSKLDQERDIWIVYDYPCSVFEPEFIKARGEICEGDERLDPDDYICFAG